MSERPQYMRKTLLADDDPRHGHNGYFVDTPTLEDVLSGIERLSGKGYKLDRNFRPFLVGCLDEGGYVLRGNFEDVSAAFSVNVELKDANRTAERIAAIDLPSRRILFSTSAAGGAP